MKAKFNKIFRYCIEAECEEPLHVGSGNGDSEILSDAVTMQPIIQGTSLAGVFSDYMGKVYSADQVEALFGRKCDEEKANAGKIYFSEAEFTKSEIEMRTRVSIDPETESVKTQGDNVAAGQVMDVEYVAAGSVFRFSITMLDSDEMIINTLAALNKGYIKIGGKNTIGCGRVSLKRVTKAAYDMSKSEDRKKWQQLNIHSLFNDNGKNILGEVQNAKIDSPYYEIKVDMKLRTPFLIKANTVDEKKISECIQLGDKERMPDTMSIMNGRREFIIPGSSLKGVFRNRIQMISDYLGLSKDAVKSVFENKSKVVFEDSVIYPEKHVTVQPRIHLNKLTGSVIDNALFSEMTIGGKTQVNILVSKEMTDLSPESVVAFILYCIRDLKAGAVSIGSGIGIGRGFMDVDKISIYYGNEKSCEYAFAGDLPEFMTQCMEKLSKERQGA